MTSPDVLALRVCVVSTAAEPGPLLDHLTSTLVAGVRLSARSRLDEADGDVIWVDGPGLPRHEAGRSVADAARRGALVIVSDPGLIGEPAVGVPWCAARFPPVAADLRSLQALLAALLRAVGTTDLPVLFGRKEATAVDLPGTEALVDSETGAWCARVHVGAGEILWLGLLPEGEGAGFRVASHIPLRAAA